MMKYNIKPYKAGFKLQILERLLFFNVVVESYYGKTEDELLDVIIDLEKEKQLKKLT